jgi:hypothetical protein
MKNTFPGPNGFLLVQLCTMNLMKPKISTTLVVGNEGFGTRKGSALVSLKISSTSDTKIESKNERSL